MKRLLLCAAAVLALAPSMWGQRVRDGHYELELFTTNDVHGRYFDSLYVGTGTRESLLAVNAEMNERRAALGDENVILIDAGDCMQGDNASYYFNYVDTSTKHLYARMAEYMRYDAIVVGNHDIETGHAVYDRVRETMDIPFLAANAVRVKNGKPYFQDYTIIRRHGLKIAIVGCTNAGIKSWLSPEIWSGMTFESLVPYTQKVVDRVIRKEKPHVVIVAVHSGTGPGDGSQLESQGRDLLYSLNGVDFLVCSHDHRAYTEQYGDIVLINSGSHCRNLGHGVISLDVRKGKIISKYVKADLVPIEKNKVDEAMRDAFRADYDAVKKFTCEKVGELGMPLTTRSAYNGMCDYMNLIHTVCLRQAPAQLSFAAPLTYNGYVKKGDVIFNDLFTIYHYENQLFVVKMTGRQIKDYLEYSYNLWISGKDGHVLNIVNKPDSNTGDERWSFARPTYNFDSMAGAFYTVDVTKPFGSRVEISALADGTPFSLDETYNVAMNSYRASGGGHIMNEGAGIDTDRIDDIVVARYPEIRELLHDYFSSHVSDSGEIVPVTSSELSDPAVMGGWKFIPESADRDIAADMHLLFPQWE